MDLLDRLHESLRTALGEHGAPGTAAPTVADVYQRLIPYRSVRSELGILELAEYEHALLRLLAGERGYVEIGEEHARAELLAELSSPNPILGVYRDYSAAPVRVVDAGHAVADGGAAGAGGRTAAPVAESTELQRLPELPELPGSLGAAAADETVEKPRAAPAAGGGSQASPAPAQDALSAPAGPPRSPASRNLDAAAPAGGAKACVHCRAELPGVADVRFCPACGGDQRDTDCAGCGSPLRAEWRFCIRCGTPRPGVSPRS